MEITRRQHAHVLDSQTVAANDGLAAKNLEVHRNPRQQLRFGQWRASFWIRPMMLSH